VIVYFVTPSEEEPAAVAPSPTLGPSASPSVAVQNNVESMYSIALSENQVPAATLIQGMDLLVEQVFNVANVNVGLRNRKLAVVGVSLPSSLEAASTSEYSCA
jgi:hypothetical protein